MSQKHIDATICYLQLLIYIVPISATESLRNVREGSWFITELCYQLDSRRNNCHDLLELMTKVIDSVVIKQYAGKDKDDKEIYYSQTPEIVSFLHRSVILP